MTPQGGRGRRRKKPAPEGPRDSPREDGLGAGWAEGVASGRGRCGVKMPALLLYV